MRTKRKLEKEAMKRESKRPYLPQAIGIRLSDIPLFGSSDDVTDKWHPVKFVHYNLSEGEVEQLKGKILEREREILREKVLQELGLPNLSGSELMLWMNENAVKSNEPVDEAFFAARMSEVFMPILEQLNSGKGN